MSPLYNNIFHYIVVRYYCTTRNNVTKSTGVYRIQAASRSPKSHTLAVIRASIAGVTRKALWVRQKLCQGKYRQYAAQRFSHFFEKAFVGRVRRRMCILIVTFWRPTWDV